MIIAIPDTPMRAVNTRNANLTSGSSGYGVIAMTAITIATGDVTVMMTTRTATRGNLDAFRNAH